LAEAVITAVTFAFTALTVPVKPALLDPAGTVTLAGTTRLAELLARLTPRPPAGAGPLSVTVQETLPAPATAAGLQDKADTPCCVGCAMAIWVPVPFAGMAFPAPVAAVTPDTGMAVEASAAVGDRLTVTCATTPSATTFSFVP
jgi:hypothetical protein